jgi:selenide,water dikinase
MDKHNPTPHTKQLLLIGGGHSHLSVIKQLGMHPVAGLQVTVISKDIHTPYSGMVPGMIAGHYSHDDAHIDLRKLCEVSGISLIHDQVIEIDPEQQLVFCEQRPSLSYNWLSINIGSQPALTNIPGAENTGAAVKPISTFIRYWQDILETCRIDPKPRNIAIVGGGAASVEVALACQFQAQKELGVNSQLLKFSLLSGSTQLLPSHNQRVQHYMAKMLTDRGIELFLGHAVLDVGSSGNKQQLNFSNRQSSIVDEVIWAIHAGSPDWPRQAGLDCDKDGFIRVNQFLQSTSHNTIFAAGDIAHFDPQPLAKSGVYAVRAGKYLADNLRSMVSGKPLKPYRPQKSFLSILMTGNKQAIASKSQFSIAGEWVWRWKDFIDRGFMDKFRITPIINNGDKVVDDDLMRCGGCGAKIGNSILSRVLEKLDVIENKDIEIGLNSPDDAAVINPPNGKQWLQTVDYFRAFIDDPYLLGRIATNHCLSDIYAMGGTPHSALAIATVPYASEELIENSLLQLMSGAVDSLNEQQTSLIGGHSSEGAELGFGLSVNGTIDRNSLLTKSNLHSGQVLVLTKPIGTGTLFAANMRGQAEGNWIDNALEQMLISNRLAASIIHQYGATACTDITGFGLLGHLLEMLNAATNCSAQITMDSLPILTGADKTTQAGWLSSLHTENSRADRQLRNAEEFRHHPYYRLLFDPQTAGGLLAVLPADRINQCLDALHQADCPDACVIGSICLSDTRTEVIMQ